MSDLYPAKFPYKCRQEKYAHYAMGWAKKCGYCGTSVEYPLPWTWWIPSRFPSRRTIMTTGSVSRTPAALCSEKCANEYFWVDFCLMRLNGAFR